MPLTIDQHHDLASIIQRLQALADECDELVTTGLQILQASTYPAPPDLRDLEPVSKRPS